VRSLTRISTTQGLTHAGRRVTRRWWLGLTARSHRCRHRRAGGQLRPRGGRQPGWVPRAGRPRPRRRRPRPGHQPGSHRARGVVPHRPARPLQAPTLVVHGTEDPVSPPTTPTPSPRASRRRRCQVAGRGPPATSAAGPGADPTGHPAPRRRRLNRRPPMEPCIFLVRHPAVGNEPLPCDHMTGCEHVSDALMACQAAGPVKMA
jgi:pimeloyl-ACP methyl ester carboxylesterase